MGECADMMDKFSYSRNDVLTVLALFRKETFLCPLCRKIVFPNVSIVDDGRIEFEIESVDICGGLGNRVLYKNVCDECRKQMTIGRNFI